MAAKLLLANKNNKLVSISEVDSGLACGCICPACDSKLIARKGNYRAHHFAHYMSPECKYSIETAVHRFAKEVIEKHKRIKLPNRLGFIDPLKNIELSESRYFDFDEVILEKKTGSIRPDIILKKNGRPLLVEVFVTNQINQLKKEKILDLNISCIEINLKDHYHMLEQDKDKIELLIIDDTKIKSWIHNSKYSQKKTVPQVIARIEEAIPLSNQSNPFITTFKDAALNDYINNNYQDLNNKYQIKKMKGYPIERKYYGPIMMAEYCYLKDLDNNANTNKDLNCWNCQYNCQSSDSDYILCLADFLENIYKK